MLRSTIAETNKQKIVREGKLHVKHTLKKENTAQETEDCTFMLYII